LTLNNLLTIKQKMMKNTLTMLVVLLVLNFHSFGQSNQNVHVVIDKTGSYPNKKAVKTQQIINASLDKDKSLELNISEINDVSINEIFTYKLDEKSIWETSVNRSDDLAEFYEKSDEKLTEIFNKTGGKEESSIYLWLCQIFTEIQNSNASHKTVIIFSDMIEHSRLTCSMYSIFKNKSNYSSEHNNIIATLNSTQQLPDLNSVNIIVVYSPDLDTEAIYYHARKFWKQFLESAGATVKFQANF